MTPQVPGALKLPFVAALALALVLPASAIDGSVVGTSCHREATACDANAECSTCRGGLERGMLATECQGYSGLLDPRRSFCKVLEASYCCNVGESGQTQACLAEDLIMEYLECLLGGRECSTIEDMPCYGEESRASVPRELSAAGEDEVSSVDAGYVEDSGSSPSPSYPLTTTPGPTSQLKFFTSATGSPTSMAVGLEGGLGTGVVKGTLSAMGVPMSLIDEVGEKVAVQEAVCALTLCPGGSSSVIVGESELGSDSRRALETVKAARPRRWPARRRLLVFEAVAFAIPTGQGMTGSQQAAAMFNKMALLETLSPAASVLGVDVENLSFDNLRYFQGAESEVSITVNPEFLVDQDEIGGGTTTGSAAFAGIAMGLLAPLMCCTLCLRCCQGNKKSRTAMVIEDEERGSSAGEAPPQQSATEVIQKQTTAQLQLATYSTGLATTHSSLTSDALAAMHSLPTGVVGATGDAETHLMAKSTGLGEKKSPLHTSGNRLSQSYAQDLVQLYAEFKDSDVSSDNAASDFTRDHSKAQTQKHKMNPLFVDDSRNHRNQQRSLPGQIAEGVEVKEAVALGKSHESAAASGNKDPVASRPSPVQEKVLDSQTRCKNGSSDERPTTATVPCLPASTATAARQPASATITSSRPHLVEGDRLGTLAQHCSVTGDGGMAIAVQPGDGLASTATAARQPASATITSSRPHLVGGDRLGTLAQHCSVTGDRGMAIAVQPGDGLDLTAAKTTVASVDRPGSTGRRSPDGRGREAGAAVWGSPAIAHDRATRTPNGAHQQQTRDWGEAIEAAAKSVLDENGANGARPAPVEAYEALTANAAGVQDADSERFPSPLRDDVTNDNPLDPTEPQEQTIGVAVVQVYGSSKTGGFGGRGYREGSRKGERPTTPNRRSAPSPIRVFATAPVSTGILTSAMVAKHSSKGAKRGTRVGVNWADSDSVLPARRGPSTSPIIKKASYAKRVRFLSLPGEFGLHDSESIEESSESSLWTPPRLPVSRSWGQVMGTYFGTGLAQSPKTSPASGGDGGRDEHVDGHSAPQEPQAGSVEWAGGSSFAGAWQRKKRTPNLHARRPSSGESTDSSLASLTQSCLFRPAAEKINLFLREGEDTDSSLSSLTPPSGTRSRRQGASFPDGPPAKGETAPAAAGGADTASTENPSTASSSLPWESTQSLQKTNRPQKAPQTLGSVGRYCLHLSFSSVYPMRLSAIHMLAASAAPVRAFVASAAPSVARFAGGSSGIFSGARQGLRGAVLASKARPVSRTMRMANSQRLGDPIGQMMDKTDVFIFDCDGVIWKGDSLIEGVPSVLDRLRQAGKRIFFVTNNSTKSRKGYKSKFDSLGLSVEPEEIFSSSFAAAAYLEQTRFKDTGKKVYIVGEVGIEEELDLIGVPHFGGPSDGSKGVELKPGFALPHDENVGAVVVGFDRMINYYKIQYAQLCINENPGCEFIATNTDAVTHLTDAQEWAGNGAMVGAIKGCTGVEPTIVGKPGPLMIDYIIQKYNVERSRICMVGDRLDTDVLFGANNGLMSILTLSGVTTEEKLLSPENKINPDYYVNSINDFFPFYT